MNPFPLVVALWRGRRVTLLLFVALIAAAVALGVAATAQERALRKGSARASQAFDLVVAAPGSQVDVLLSAVFLRPTAMELLPGPVLARLMAEPAATMVAPIAFGDSHAGAPIVGSTAALVDRLAGGLAEGRMFAAAGEAVVGATLALDLGDSFHPTHGMPDEVHAEDHDEDHDSDHDADHDHDRGGHDDHDHDEEGEHAGHAEHHAQSLTVVGRMKPTGTPWDRAIVVPVEFVWLVHGLPTGHAEGSNVIGPPFDPDHLPGVPAAVVTPESFAAAYGLRNAYRTTETMAFFPAEALVGLYDVMGDIRSLVAALTLATQVLVVAAIVLGVLMLVDLQRSRLALLRVLGAPRRLVFLTVWILVAGLVAAGAALGLGLGFGVAAAISAVIADETGIALPVAIGWGEVGLAALIVATGAILALLPAVVAYRRPALPL